MELSYYDGIWAYGCIIVAFLIVTLAQVILRVVYAKWKQVDSNEGMTGAEVAKEILKANDINDVKVVEISGNLTDNFNNSNRTVSLSKDIYSGSSIASLSVAAHECGHVIQYKVGYKPIKLRNKMVNIVNFGNTIGYIIMGIGLLASVTELFVIGIILLSLAVVFQLVTLPCEFNASKRANKELLRLGLIDESESRGVKSMLKAAAFTYVAGLFNSILQILRLVFMYKNRRKK
jgi:hypothetical protein